MAANILFNFGNLTGKDPASKKAIQYFTRAGARVVSALASGGVKRNAGISYKEIVFTFTDNQVVSLLIKSTGDIYQAKVNGGVAPIKNQEDQVMAIGELVAAMDAKRTKFQQALARTRVALPPTLRTAAPKIELALQEKISSLNQAIEETRAQIAELA